MRCTNKFLTWDGFRLVDMRQCSRSAITQRSTSRRTLHYCAPCAERYDAFCNRVVGGLRRS